MSIFLILLLLGMTRLLVQVGLVYSDVGLSNSSKKKIFKSK